MPIKKKLVKEREAPLTLGHPESLKDSTVPWPQPLSPPCRVTRCSQHEECLYNHVYRVGELVGEKKILNEAKLKRWDERVMLTFRIKLWIQGLRRGEER